MAGSFETATTFAPSHRSSPAIGVGMLGRTICRQLLRAAWLLALASRLHPAAAQYVSSKSMDFFPADQYPFAAMLLNKEGGPRCTGVLVGNRAVLTAASCVVASGGKPTPDLVFVGMSNIFLDIFKREGKYEIQRAKQIVTHPDFDVGSPQHSNLALVVLERPSREKPVALPSATRAFPANGTVAIALGFGSRSDDGYWPQLHEDTLVLLPQDECQGLQMAYSTSALQPDGKPAQACTALSHSFRACAAGNLGAPLLEPSGAGGGAPLQLGLLVSGFSCSSDPTVASASSPALYTWLPHYADWLEAQLAAVGE